MQADSGYCSLELPQVASIAVIRAAGKHKLVASRTVQLGLPV